MVQAITTLSLKFFQFTIDFIFKLRGFSIGFVLWLEYSANRHINPWENHLLSIKLAVDQKILKLGVLIAWTISIV